jgi:hypothetical protein
MSKLLNKALKSAILPASLLVSGKFISVFLLISYLGYDFFVTNEKTNLFSIQLYLSDASATLFVNSYSNLITLLLIAIPTLFMIVQITLLKNAQTNPRVVVKLTRLNILKWVTGSDNSLVKVLSWTIFLWIISGIVISASINSQTYGWIGILAGVLSLLCSWGLLRTFELETDKIYPEEDKRYL